MPSTGAFAVVPLVALVGLVVTGLLGASSAGG